MGGDVEESPKTLMQKNHLDKTPKDSYNIWKLNRISKLLLGEVQRNNCIFVQ